MAFNKIFKNIKTSIENILENNNEQSGKSGENIHDMSGEIQQGRLYLQHRKKEEIEYINSQKRLRVSEGFENIENETYDTSVKKVIQSEMNEIKQLETKFNEILSKYSTMHRQFMNDSLQFINLKNNKYNGKILITPSNKKYYITNYGVAKEMTDALFKQRHKTCSSVQNVNQEDLTKLGLVYGEIMNKTIPCGFEGKNVFVAGTPDNKLTGKIQDNTIVYRTNDYSVKYLGCYADFGVNKNGVNNRTLPTKLPGGPDTFEQLVKKAAEGNWRYLGLQYAGGYGWEKAQGWVGNTTRFENYSRPLYTDSNITEQEIKDKYYCKLMKNSDNIYGGYSWTNAVYEIIMNGKAGYVDEDSTLRLYPSGKIINDEDTCPSTINTIDEDTWKLFQQGENMEKSTLCNLGKIDPEVKDTIQKYYKQLYSIATEIQNKINSTNTLIQKISNKNLTEKQKLQTDLDQFNSLLSDFKNIETKNPTLMAILEDSKLKYGMENYEYIGYTILTLMLLFLMMKYAR